MDTQVSLGTRFRSVLSQIAQALFVSAGTTSVKLPKTFNHRAITFRLRGSLVVGVATATGKAESPLQLIQKIELLGDGRKVYWAISGRDAYRLSALMMGKAGELSAPVLTVGTNPFAATFQVHHEAVGMRMPPDSFFDPRRHEEIELRITWGAATDIATIGGGGTIAIDAATYLDCLLEQTTEGGEAIQFNRLISYREFTVAATNQTESFEVSRNGLLVGIMFRTDRDGVPVNNIINKINLKSDSSFLHADGLRWDTLQGKNTIEHHLDRPQSLLGTAGYSATFAPTDFADNIEGYCFLPLIEDGMLSSALNTLALNTLEVVLDITKTSGTEVIRSTFVFYEPRDAA